MTVRKRTSKHRAHNLTAAEWNELHGGCRKGESVFESDEQREEVWRLVAHSLGHLPGHRPWAFWRYTPGAPGGEETDVEYVHGAAEIEAASEVLRREQLRYLLEHELLEPGEAPAIDTGNWS